MATKKVSRNAKSPKPVKVLSSQEDALATKIIKASGVRKSHPRIGTRNDNNHFIIDVKKVSPAVRELYAMHAAIVESNREMKAQMEKNGKRMESLYDRFWLQAKTELGLHGADLQYQADTQEMFILDLTK